MKYLMLYTLLLLTLASCSLTDPEPNLPPETSTGENTAGFVVDGKTVVLPSNSYSSVPGGGEAKGLVVQTGPNFSSPNNTTYFTIQIANFGANTVYKAIIRMHKYPSQDEVYVFGGNNGEYFADGPNYPQMTIITGKKGSETQWYYSKPNSGSVSFSKVDNNLKIYSGTFKATLYNRFDESKTIEITKGRFDIDLNK